MKMTWSAVSVSSPWIALATLAALPPAPADAQAQPSCDLSYPSILADETKLLTDVGACLYHVRIPDDAYASRSFKLLVPHGFKEKTLAPRMVVDFHGYGSSKASQRKNSCWQRKAVEKGFVVAYPNGTGVPTSFSAGDYCCDLTVGLVRDDVQFAKDVVAEAQAILSEDPELAVDIDAWKTYASGLSNGGAMAHELACEANDVFDGVAPVSQTYSKRPAHSCIEPEETPIPVIDFRATDDDYIPYDGSFSWLTLSSWLSADESRQAWEKALGCNGMHTEEVYSPGTYCWRMQGCAADFVQCTIAGGHLAYEFATAAKLDICDAAWEFFGEQPADKLPQ